MQPQQPAQTGTVQQPVYQPHYDNRAGASQPTQQQEDPQQKQNIINNILRFQAENESLKKQITTINTPK